MISYDAFFYRKKTAFVRDNWICYGVLWHSWMWEGVGKKKLGLGTTGLHFLVVYIRACW